MGSLGISMCFYLTNFYINLKYKHVRLQTLTRAYFPKINMMFFQNIDLTE